MSKEKTANNTPAHHNHENFETGSLEDELRINQLCKQLLKEFHQYLLEKKQLDPLEAGQQAAGADYFLLDFLIDNQRTNIFASSDLMVKRFAANWYIISNLEPNIEELNPILNGTASFYHYCAELKLVEKETAELIAAASQQIDYYSQRIEDFLDISDDGFIAWNRECPLK